MVESTEIQAVLIGDFGRVFTGKTPPSSRPELFGNIYPFITPTDISGASRYITTERYLSEAGCRYQQQYLLPAGSTCFVCIGATIGKVCMIDRPSFTNQQINAVVIDSDRFDNRFVYYLLCTLSNRIKTLASGAATPIVNKSIFSSVSVNVPPLPTQRKIAAILSAYDNLIEKNNRRIKILEEMARMIYREWFVNFHFPGHENNRLVDSQVGKIPEGWQVGRLDDAVVLQRGFDLPTSQRLPGSIPVYAATGQVGWHREAKVTGPGVITGRSGSLGTVTYVSGDYWPLNTTLWVKEFKQSTPLHAYHLLSELDFAQFNSGTAVPTLNRNDVHGLPVLLPPTPVLNLFNENVLPMYQLIDSLQTRNENLRRTRDLLLPKLVSGALDVSELDIETEEDAA